jgi:galactokinase
VIAAAIDMKIEIIAEPRNDDEVHIFYQDLGEKDTFSLERPVTYRNQRDYIRSAFNVMARRGIRPLHGWNLQVKGNIPIAAGLSSSSAMTTGAVMTVATMAQKKLSRDDIALAAYDAEVAEFGESGGKMDHYASAFGGVIHVDTNLGKVANLPAKLASIIIGDSCEKKQDTVGDLRFIKTAVEREYEKISHEIDSFDRRTTPVNALYKSTHQTRNRERRMALATLRNRDLTNKALELLNEKNPDPEELGRMLTEHHRILRDEMDRSTPKIEKMITSALEAGALGCKINGSGGGGSMMAYCNRNDGEIASAIEQSGGKAYFVKVSTGLTTSVWTLKEF